MSGKQLYLQPDEAKFLSMSVVSMLEQLKEASTDQTINWNPTARKTLREMTAAGKTLAIKMERIGIEMSPIPDYKDGDEDDFLTKQS